MNVFPEDRRLIVKRHWLLRPNWRRPRDGDGLKEGQIEKKGNTESWSGAGHKKTPLAMRAWGKD